MTTQPCRRDGCGRLMTPRWDRKRQRWSAYCSPGCAGYATLAAIDPDTRRAHARAAAARIPKALRQVWGQKGGRATKTERWAPLLRRWRNESPHHAIRDAYKAGYNAGFLAGRGRRIA